MNDSKAALTDQIVTGLLVPATGRYLVRDTELAGFFVLVGQRSKTFMVQGDLRVGDSRQTVRMKIGRADRLTTRKARAAAKEILGKIARGEDPRAPAQKSETAPSNEPTLGTAWARYCEAHMERKGRSEKTIKSYRDHVERLLIDWLDMSLHELGNDPKTVIDRHEQITKTNGPYIANACMRSLRAIYNHARRSCRTLPSDNPVSAIDWNSEHRRDTGMGMNELKPWFGQARALNPIRREFHLLLLLSGSRPDALKRAKPQDVDFRRRTLHISKPKGGEYKAFDIPLSRAMCRCLIRALRLGRMLYPDEAADWIFPADSKSGHLAEHKEDRRDLAKWGNELRQTYRTVGQIAGSADLDMHLLMNHSLPGVNAGYITRSKLLSDHLRKQQETLSSLILSRAVSENNDTEWPNLPSRESLKSTEVEPTRHASNRPLTEQ